MEDYKKKYEQAMLRMNKWVEGSEIIDPKEVAEYIFPELKEPKDERVRKEILEYFQQFDNKELREVNISDWISWLEKQSEPTDKGEISDGYHTFNELYYYRMLYNAAFFNMLPKEWVHKSKKHNDGKECFGGGWFVVMANLPTGQISNHYELKYWDLFSIPEKEFADKWDGHTPQEAAERLYSYLLKKQGEQKLIDKIQLGKKYKCIASPRYSTFMIGEIYKPEDKFLCSLMNFCSDCFEPIEDGKQIPAWSEEDENYCLDVNAAVSDYFDEGYAEELKDWLKSLKNRVQPQPKQEWSEDDKAMLDSAIAFVEHSAFTTIGKGKNNVISWLKSLKERMKGE